MTAWWWRVAPYAVCAVLAVVLWSQRGTITAQATTITQFGERLDAQDAALRTISDGIKQAAASQRALASTQETFRAALDERQADIGALKRENEEFRLWADGLLPDAVAGLRVRPAITGANGYAEYLRTRRALHPAGGAPDLQ